MVVDIIAKRKLLHMNKTAIRESIENAHRTGMRKEEKPRHIIIRLIRRYDASHILQQAKNDNANKSVKVVRDKTSQELTLRKKALPQLKKAWSDGKRAGITRDLKLIIDGHVVPVE